MRGCETMRVGDIEGICNEEPMYNDPIWGCEDPLYGVLVEDHVVWSPCEGPIVI